LKAKKSLGQNFLVDSSTASRIVNAVSPSLEDIVLEVGPGRGALTRLLIERAGLVLAVEIDRELAEILRNELPSERLAIVEADILETDLSALLADARRSHPDLLSRMRVVANLPYYISTAVILQFIDARESLKDLTLMVQREVAERIISLPGNRDYGSLSVFVQIYCKARRLFNVPPGAFRPSPKVDSSILHLEILDEPVLPVKDKALLYRVVRAAFAQRRKTIMNSLKSASATIDPHLGSDQILPILESARIRPERRAETLSPPEFICLTDQFAISLSL
jgi:16S rRNA (adenine1518-N6/adenine1519-N6)-dimethyltransferase